MSDIKPTVESVQKYLDHLKKCEKNGAGNVPSFIKREKEEYKEAVKKIGYWPYAQSADHHYFVARLLYLHHIFEYSCFCSHQCVENYLKSYLKLKKQVPPNIHDLDKLVKQCRNLTLPSDSFIHSDNLSIVISMYKPFYEFPRYPVQKGRPKPPYAFLFPNDIYVLDYFVLKMRELISIPNNTWDILKQGHFSLFHCKRLSPNFYNLFFSHNINFTDEGRY